MRKGLLGSFAALAAGAGTAWGQAPVDPGAPAGVPIVAQGAAGPGVTPVQAVMPPGNFGPPGDPLGLGPVGGFGPPPGPMYPMPGPYAQQSYQPAPDAAGLGYGNAPHWWFDGEYLLWFSRGQQISFPVLTTSAPSDMGVVGTASTTALVGQPRRFGYDAFNGLRMTAGFFGDADRRFGFQMSGFTTETQVESRKFGNTSNTLGLPVLARPFLDVAGVQGALVLSGPLIGPARARVSTTSQTYSLDPVGVWNLYRAEPGSRRVWSLDVLAGYRYLELHEDLTISSTTQFNGVTTTLPSFTTGPFGTITQTGGTTVLTNSSTSFGGTTITAPASIDIRDSIRTLNRFNGFQVGLKGDARYGIITTNGFAKVAVGEMYERVDILGSSSVTSTNATTGARSTVGSSYGGVLATASNIGTYTHSRYSYIPEAGLNVGIALTGGLTGFVGVNILYFPDVVRPGTNLSPMASSAAIPFSTNYGTLGAPRGPAFRMIEEDHWLGGATFGLSLRY